MSTKTPWPITVFVDFEVPFILETDNDLQNMYQEYCEGYWNEEYYAYDSNAQPLIIDAIDGRLELHVSTEPPEVSMFDATERYRRSRNLSLRAKVRRLFGKPDRFTSIPIDASPKDLRTLLSRWEEMR